MTIMEREHGAGLAGMPLEHQAIPTMVRILKCQCPPPSDTPFPTRSFQIVALARDQAF